MSANGQDPSKFKFRSRAWFDDPDDPGMTALYVERYQNQGFTREELQSGKPIIGIAQTGSDLSPCNKIHVFLADRVRAGIRDAGGIPMEFPVHPIQETGKRPTAALDRNLAYLSLVESLNGYPIDAVILTTGCDKTTPALLMGAATVDIPAIALNGGPMLDGHWRGKLAGSGMVVWEGRRQLAEGKIDYDEFMDLVCASAPSLGHCNTMGTASTMNALAEALGMMLPGSAQIPAPYRERMEAAYRTGRRIVEMAHEDLRPSAILTKAAFRNAIRVNTCIGGSTNAPIHINAVARHIGVDLDIREWETEGLDLPLLVDMQPAGRFLGEGFHRAGGVAAVMGEMQEAGLLVEDALTVTGRTAGENVAGRRSVDHEAIRTVAEPMREAAGFKVLTGNLFDSALMKTSVISADFRSRFLSRPGEEGIMEAKAVVFEGPEDYHDRIDDPALGIDEETILFIRNVGPLGYPGAAEVVNMQPPTALLEKGVTHLPTVGDGRQSGTSESPSILNASPESAAGSGLALLKTGDRVKLDIPAGRLDMVISDEELEARRAAWSPPELENHTPWQKIYRDHVGPLSTGGCLEFATQIRQTSQRLPRHNH